MKTLSIIIFVGLLSFNAFSWDCFSNSGNKHQFDTGRLDAKYGLTFRTDRYSDYPCYKYGFNAGLTDRDNSESYKNKERDLFCSAVYHSCRERSYNGQVTSSDPTYINCCEEGKLVGTLTAINDMKKGRHDDNICNASYQDGYDEGFNGAGPSNSTFCFKIGHYIGRHKRTN